MMHRFLPHTLLFIVVTLLQTFLFDNLSISVYFNPLIYIVFLLLMPLDTPPIGLLGAGLLLGVTMDYTMGAAGVNTIATLPIAFLRPWIIDLFVNRDGIREGGIPSADRMGSRKFLEYLIVTILLHHVIFFSFEALSWNHVLQTVLRIVVSTIVTIGFSWLIARFFTAKFTVRV